MLRVVGGERDPAADGPFLHLPIRTYDEVLQSYSDGAAVSLEFYSIDCLAPLVGVLWANIGAVYPIIKVATQRESMQQWIGKEIAKARENAAEKTAELRQLDRQLEHAPAADRPALEAAKDDAQASRKAEEKALSYFEFFQPYIDRYLPAIRFRPWSWSSA